MKRTLNILAIALAAIPGLAALAQQPQGYFDTDLTPQTLRVQAKAEELFQRRHFHRARVIYRNDLAPIGDKYAQYMLGFMNLSGLGAEPDPALASAWFRLAAERGKPPEFVKIRDEQLAKLDHGERIRSDEIFLQLGLEYSDIAISMREAREAFEDIEQVTTGSRLGSMPSTAMIIIEPRSGGSESGDAHVYNAQRRMQGHLDYVTSCLGIDRIRAETVTAATLANLEERVQDYVARLATR